MGGKLRSIIVQEIKTENPTISVVMPVLNAEAFLQDAIDSILCQTFSDFEFIAIDDGSTDRSAEILKRNAQKDVRIKIIRNEETVGLANGLNQGVAAAKGKYIARMDADDISLPERFTEQINYLAEHPEAAVLGTWASRCDENGQLLDMNVKPPCTPKEINDQLAKTSCCVVHPSVMMRKDVLNQYGGYFEGILDGEDIELWCRLKEHCEIHNLPKILLHYRASFHGLRPGRPERNSKMRMALMWREKQWAQQKTVNWKDNFHNLLSLPVEHFGFSQADYDNEVASHYGSSCLNLVFRGKIDLLDEIINITPKEFQKYQFRTIARHRYKIKDSTDLERVVRSLIRSRKGNSTLYYGALWQTLRNFRNRKVSFKTSTKMLGLILKSILLKRSRGSKLTCDNKE